MEFVRKNKGSRFYKHKGAFFIVHDFSKLTMEEITDRIMNVQKYIPHYVTKHYEERCKEPLPLYCVSRYDVQPQNMSLFEYEVLIKGSKAVAPALKSACIQQYSKETIIIACEPYDSESDLTRTNCKIIEDYVRKHEEELLQVTCRESLEMEWYM